MIYPEITYKIRSIAYDIYSKVIGNWNEDVYEDIYFDALINKSLNVTRQKEFEVYYKEIRVGLYRTDLIVDNKIILELKTVPEIFPLHKAQIISYLKVTGLPLGMLINFGGSKIYMKAFPNYVSDKKVLKLNYDINKTNLNEAGKKQIAPFIAITKEILEILGPGFFHQVYRRAYYYELQQNEIGFELIKYLELNYNGKKYAEKEVRFFKIDKLLISVVAVKKIDNQLISNFSKFIKYYNCKKGLLINFNNTMLDYRYL